MDKKPELTIDELQRNHLPPELQKLLKKQPDACMDYYMDTRTNVACMGYQPDNSQESELEKEIGVEPE